MDNIDEKTDDYYKEIGFMCGLEIHQRLATKEKLFCSCSASLPTTEPKAASEITRYQRAVAGELGIVDRAASFEQEKDRQFIYKIDNKHACLVDIDEEPPHGLNHEALELSLSIANSLNMIIPDEIEPMRKMVVDGSNPSSFQRTTKIAMDGVLDLNGHKINIISLFLEEESAGIEATNQYATTFDTSRIGIPLVEIDTDPYLRSPKEAKEAALKIGTLLRFTGKVQRGIGSIRQDVNVSIKGGVRVEIKGLQDVDFMDRFIENEILRQQNLIKIKEELSKKERATVGKELDITELLKSTKVKIISSAISANGIVIGFPLYGFKGFLGREINPDRRLGSEISDYAKMGGVNGIIHSDEDLKEYGFTEEEKYVVSKVLGVGKDDAFILIAGKRQSVTTASGFARSRASFAINGGVQLETRATINNNLYTTRFMRPLPGGSRMYPETDSIPILLNEKTLKESKKHAPDLEKEREAITAELKSKALADQIIMSPRLQLYKELSSSTKANKIFIANILLQKFTELKRANHNVDKIDPKRLVELFNSYEKEKITKNGVEEVLKALASADADVEALIEKHGLWRISGKHLKKLVQEETPTGGAKNKGEIINRIMSKHRLNVDGEELNATLDRDLK